MPELAGLAFLAGVVSFLSPCVLPLVPGYLSYMSGFATGQATQARASRATVVAIAFVGGFTAVFAALGASATVLGSFLREYKTGFAQVGGLFIILLGLVFMGVIKIPWLYREARFHPTPRAGLWGSVVLGAAFAFGWSPCIGVTMGVALTMAAGQGTTGGVLEGVLLLVIYSLGLGLPFVLSGIGITRLTGAVRWLRRHTRAVNLASGLLLIVVGVLFVTEELFQISIWMQKSLAAVDLDFWNF
jgi:cytochrome c-type biogenesis protein